MLSEEQLIGRVRELSQIKPKKDWVVFTKREVLGVEPGFSFFPYLKPAFAGFIAVCLLFGAFGLVKNSLPGDFLYSVKKIVHEGREVITPVQEKPAFQLKLANNRLEDLTRVSVKNLAPTISEFQANISAAAENLAKIDATTSDPIVTQQIVEQTKKIKENEEKVKILGMVIEGEETENFDKAVTKYLIKDLESRTLTEEKEIILKEAKELFEEEKYSEALELLLININQ